MTIQEIESTISDLGQFIRPGIMPADGGLTMAPKALEGFPARNSDLDANIEGLEPIDAGLELVTSGHQSQSKAPKQIASEVRDKAGHNTRTDLSKDQKESAKEKNDIYVSSSIMSRLTEAGLHRNGKSQNINYEVFNNSQPQRKRNAAARESMDSLIGGNIAGNNAMDRACDELLPIMYTGTPEVGKVLSTAECPTCGETISSAPGSVCRQCYPRTKHADPNGGTLDELLAYAHSFASSVKKMFYMQGGPKLRSKKPKPGNEPQTTSVPTKPQESQIEIAKQRVCSLNTVLDDKQGKQLLEPTLLAPPVCMDDLETMSAVDGDAVKDCRGRLERQISVTSATDSRPPFTRTRTKVKALFSSSRTKTFRSNVLRTRTNHELKGDSMLSSRMDGKRGGFSEASRKSGRTQTFDSSNLHGRKDVVCRSKLEVITEGTSVDPPNNDEKAMDKSLKYAISRSATSPGTNVSGVNKLQREKSGFSSGGPLLRTNTKLTLRANKAAALRMETIQRANALFHQQPAIDGSDASPIIERKRGNLRLAGEIRSKAKATAEEIEKKGLDDSQAISREMQLKTTREATFEESSSKHDIQPITNVPSQQQTETSISEIYCGVKDHSVKPKVSDIDANGKSLVLAKLQTHGDESAEKNPYCDGFNHYGKGLENQLLKAPAIGTASAEVLSPYFEKSAQNKSVVNNENTARETGTVYTDSIVPAEANQNKPRARNSSHLYSLLGVMSKSSTQLRETTTVRGSISDVVTARSSITGFGALSKRQVKYSETDVDSGTIYHMAKRIASDQKVSSNNEFFSAANFYIGGDVSKSSSSTSGHNSSVCTAYTGGFLADTFPDNDETESVECCSSASEQTYFGHDEKSSSKHEPVECDIYTGSVFSPSANNIALTNLNDNWKNMSTNNSNRLATYRCRSRTTMAHINNRRILNCSNNSSSRSASPTKIGPIVTKNITSSYASYSKYSRPYAQPVSFNIPGAIDFTKYDNVGMDDNSLFLTSSWDYDRLPLKQSGLSNQPSSHRASDANGAVGDDLYTPGDHYGNFNNSNNDDLSDLNNNYFGDFYTGDERSSWGASQEQRSSQSSAASGGDFSGPASKYAPGSFYENAYVETQSSPPPQQNNGNPGFGMFNRYGGGPPVQQFQSSPEYAGSFPFGSMMEERSHSPSGLSNAYEGYGKTASESPKRYSYDHDGYFDYHTSDRDEDRRTQHCIERSPIQEVPKIRRVGAIICRENVANKDDYAEDVNRDLMEDPWIPISYRLAAEQVKEMGGGRCTSRDMLKPTEARADPAFMDASPFAQGQMLEALGRKSSAWNLKQNTDSLKDDITMKWRDARDKSKQQNNQQRSKRPETLNRSVSSVWRPTDHIPAKARGNRTIKSEPRSSTAADKDGANKSNSRVWSAVMWVPSTVGGYVKKLW